MAQQKHAAGEPQMFMLGTISKESTKGFLEVETHCMPISIPENIFIEPSDPEVMVFRYMGFTKYVSFLESSSLYFSRADCLNEPFEGSYPVANVARRPLVDEKSGVRLFGNEMTSKFADWVRQWTYINCWHIGEHESSAMWKLYGEHNGAVAIISTYRKLRLALLEDINLGIVNYIDYESAILPEGNSFTPFLNKRIAFEYEHELRAIFQEVPRDPDMLVPVGRQNPEYGRLVPVDARALVDSVKVGPEAPKWLYELIVNVTKKYSFEWFCCRCQ